MTVESDVLVVGGGLAGATAALSAAREGASVRLVSHKDSTLRQASGLIDALGYVPPSRAAGDAGPGSDPTLDPTAGRTGALAERRPDPEGPLPNPFERVDALPDGHPYRLVGADAIRAGLALFDEVVGDLYRGGHTERNALLPTAGGTVKPTARYPASMAAGLASDDAPALIVGFESLPEYDARQLAARLRAAGVPFPVAGVEVAFPGEFRDDARVTRLAGALDRNEALGGDGTSRTGTPAREALADAVEPHLDAVGADGDGSDGKTAARVGFPAMLGDERAAAVRADLADRLGAEVFELPGGPPSIPGLRLEDRLFDALDEAGVRIETGNPVVGRELDEEGRIAHVLVDRKGREIPYAADAFVLATGGAVGKGIDSDREGVREPVLGCHVPHPEDRYEWFVDDAFGDQPYARFGVAADEALRPLGADGTVQYPNVRVAGATLGGADVAREKSASGVSLATGVVAGRGAAAVALDGTNGTDDAAGDTTEEHE
ncbi:glycerol-3-phosphate dehydrogenase subunit GlpB [Haloparvum sedimenti]|uniref:glycerol-3-phosphate dehydrogenase subunit GlpB n=1 Tax=Haloparvum sedimenti TaxID=1678448 RepID=UPI00071E936B|nr:glycerol-3-phosphate dehydrogenase subunit GlpB [Haloparvum sedimenti]